MRPSLECDRKILGFFMDERVALIGRCTADVVRVHRQFSFLVRQFIHFLIAFRNSGTRMTLDRISSLCHRLSVVLCCGLAGCLSTPSAASDPQDHNLARQAVAQGQVLPLKTVLERLERQRPGHVLEVELENKRGRWIYEIKQLESGGRLVKIRLDARTGELLDTKTDK